MRKSKAPPESLECERAILAAVLLAPDRFGAVSASLDSGDFADRRHRLIFDAMAALAARGSRIDQRTVQAELEQRAQLDEVGDVVYLSGLADDLPDLAGLSDYVRSVVVCAAQRRGLERLPLLESALRSREGVEAAVGAIAEEVGRIVSGAQYRLRSLAEILSDPAALDPPEPVAPRLIWRGRTTLLAGPEKCGKSTLAAAAAAAVSRGGSFLDGQCLEGDVVWLLLEEHVADLARRLTRFGANPERVLILEPSADPLATLEAVLVSRKPALAVVDTLADLAETYVKDAYSASQWTPVMQRITRAARAAETGVKLLHHARRSDGSYRDSSAIGAGVDVILEMGEGGGNSMVRSLRAKGRIPVADFRVRFLGTAFQLVDKALSVEDQVRSALRSSPDASLRQVRKAVSARNQEVDSALERLIAAGEVEDRAIGQAHRFRLTRPDTPRDTPPCPDESRAGHAPDTGGTR